MFSKDYRLHHSQLSFHNLPSLVRVPGAIEPWNEQVMFRQYLALRYLQNPDYNLDSCCDIWNSCFVRPQRVILLLIIGCPATRNDRKIASVEQKNLFLVPFDKYTSQNIVFRRLFLAPALKKLYLFWGGERGNSLKKDKLRRRRPPL